MNAARLAIRGKVPSFKNRKDIVRGKNGKPFIKTNATMKAQLDAMTLQIREQWNGEPIEHPEIDVRFLVTARRADRDNMLNAVMDALVAGGVLVNDNIRRSNGRITVEPAEVGEEEGAEITLRW